MWTRLALHPTWHSAWCGQWPGGFANGEAQLSDRSVQSRELLLRLEMNPWQEGIHPGGGSEKNRCRESLGQALMGEDPPALFSWGQTLEESHIGSYIGPSQWKTS